MKKKDANTLSPKKCNHRTTTEQKGFTGRPRIWYQMHQENLKRIYCVQKKVFSGYLYWSKNLIFGPKKLLKIFLAALDT